MDHLSVSSITRVTNCQKNVKFLLCHCVLLFRIRATVLPISLLFKMTDFQMHL